LREISLIPSYSRRILGEDLHNLAVERDIPPPLLLQENIR